MRYGCGYGYCRMDFFSEPSKEASGPPNETQVVLGSTARTFWIRWAGQPTSGNIDTLVQAGLISIVSGNITASYLTASWKLYGAGTVVVKQFNTITYLNMSGNVAWEWQYSMPPGITFIQISSDTVNWTGNEFGSANINTLTLSNFRTAKLTPAEMVIMLDNLRTREGTLPATITINDYQAYDVAIQNVTDAANELKTAKSVTTLTLGA